MKHKITIMMALALLLQVSFSNAQNGAHILIASGPCDPIIPILCPSGVEDPENAVDDDLDTYALMRTSVGLLSESFLKMGWSTPAPGGNVVGIFTDETVVLDVDVLGSIGLTLYNSSNQQIAAISSLSLADVQLLDQDRAVLRIKIPNGKTASSVQITVGGLLLLANDVKIYGAVHAPNTVSVLADYVVAEGPCDPITLGCQGGVKNSENSVDANKNNYAVLTIPLAIGGDAFLDLGWTQPGPKGMVVSFLCAPHTSPLDAALLANLNLKVYDQNNNVVLEKDGFTLADVQILGNNKFNIHAKTPAGGNYTIAHARLTLDAFVSVLTDLRVYNANYKKKTSFADYFPKMSDIAETSTSEVEVYPNPASGSINVMLNSSGSSIADLEITNMIGQTVYFDKVQPGTTALIDVGSFDNGVYIIRVHEDGQVINTKFVVEK